MQSCHKITRKTNSMNLAEQLKNQLEQLNPQDEEALTKIREYLKDQADNDFGGASIKLCPATYGYSERKIVSSLEKEGLQVTEEESWRDEEFEYTVIWSKYHPINQLPQIIDPY